MATKRGKVMLSILVVLVLLVLAGMLTIARPIAGRVIDATTREPLAGVPIVAAWRLSTGLFHPVPAGKVRIMDTVTDAHGRYRFDGWWSLSWHQLIYAVDFEDFPDLYLFQPGYEAAIRGNDTFRIVRGRRASYSFGVVYWSQWHGHDIELRALSQARIVEYARQVRSLLSEVSDVADPPGRCSWDRVARLLLAIDQAAVTAHHPELRIEYQMPLIERCGQTAHYAGSTR